MPDFLADSPRWLVILGLALVAAVLLWILAQVLKWALQLLLIALVLGGAGLAIWMLFLR